MKWKERLHSLRILLPIASSLALLPLLSAEAEQLSSTTWQYTLAQPADGWQQAGFDSGDWKRSDGGFGTHSTPAARVSTVWNTKDIWLRRTFTLDKVPAKPALLIHHDDDTPVFINEKQVPSLPRPKPFESELITTWGSEVTAENAWTEYPRPQLVRQDWTNLNGNWDYAVTPIKQTAPPQHWDGKILVPFCLESKLGGVQELLGKNEALWYHRSFDTKKTAGKRTLLTFEAVDYASEVFVNGTSVGKHVGGNTPFTFDVTEALQSGENQLVVRVEDATEEWQLNGKQRRKPHGIFYTQVSGIWQTVWMEEVSETHLSDLTIATDATAGTITITPKIKNADAVAKIKVIVGGDSKVQVITFPGTFDKLSITVPDAKLWSPASPHLYELRVGLLDESGNELDSVSSYAGIRSVGKMCDADGNLRITLNGEILFHLGPLDQGWWPDGLLTPPSDEAMLFDIEWLKEAGFNMIRKHIKVEPRRYYYHCDRVGMMVWQDHVSGGKNSPWTRMDKNPQDADWPDEQHQQFMTELERMIDELENHPSIVMWVPFNEAWGQHRTMQVGKWTVDRDPSRLVNIASGGNFWPVGDIADHHSYPHPAFPFDPARYKDFVNVVGEFGGHGYPVAGHLWDAARDNWGYGGLPKTKSEYRDRYVKSLEILDELKQKGVAAGVYTQTTDVEGEINGLMSYDRKVIKIPAKELKELHQRLYE